MEVAVASGDAEVDEVIKVLYGVEVDIWVQWIIAGVCEPIPIVWVRETVDVANGEMVGLDDADSEDDPSMPPLTPASLIRAIASHS